MAAQFKDEYIQYSSAGIKHIITIGAPMVQYRRTHMHHDNFIRIHHQVPHWLRWNSPLWQSKMHWIDLSLEVSDTWHVGIACPVRCCISSFAPHSDLQLSNYSRHSKSCLTQAQFFVAMKTLLDHFLRSAFQNLPYCALRLSTHVRAHYPSCFNEGLHETPPCGCY